MAVGRWLSREQSRSRLMLGRLTQLVRSMGCQRRSATERLLAGFKARIDRRAPTTTANGATVRYRRTVTLRYRISDRLPGCGQAVVGKGTEPREGRPPGGAFRRSAAAPQRNGSPGFSAWLPNSRKCTIT